uniref:Uncharacterized protein n=1 Tax=Heterorhabditis bacteriophora TaxID=37862 RepID=A0A1I7W722_HETBA
MYKCLVYFIVSDMMIVFQNGHPAKYYLKHPGEIDLAAMRLDTKAALKQVLHNRVAPSYLESSIQQWLRDGQLAKLEQLVLSGCGDLLQNRTSTNTDTAEFLANLPEYMEKIEGIHRSIKEGDLEKMRALMTTKKLAIEEDKIFDDYHFYTNNRLIVHFPLQGNNIIVTKNKVEKLCCIDGEIHKTWKTISTKIFVYKELKTKFVKRLLEISYFQHLPTRRTDSRLLSGMINFLMHVGLYSFLYSAISIVYDEYLNKIYVIIQRLILFFNNNHNIVVIRFFFVVLLILSVLSPTTSKSTI